LSARVPNDRESRYAKPPSLDAVETLRAIGLQEEGGGGGGGGGGVTLPSNSYAPRSGALPEFAMPTLIPLSIRSLPGSQAEEIHSRQRAIGITRGSGHGAEIKRGEVSGVDGDGEIP